MPEHNLAESRSHMGAWAIVSAPLVLGFDLRDDAKLGAAKGAYLANGTLAAANFAPESATLRTEIEREREALRAALRAARGVADDAMRARARALGETIRRQHQKCIADAMSGGGMLPQAPRFDLEDECRRARGEA